MLQAPLYDPSATIKNKDGPLVWSLKPEPLSLPLGRHFADTVPLVHPKPDAVLRLSTDASPAISAVLEQAAENGSWEPLGFFSRKLIPPQSRYSTYDRELLAAYAAAARHFLHAIAGRKTILRSDHKPLVHIFSTESDNTCDRKFVPPISYRNWATLSISFKAMRI